MLGSICDIHDGAVIVYNTPHCPLCQESQITASVEEKLEELTEENKSLKEENKALKEGIKTRDDLAPYWAKQMKKELQQLNDRISQNCNKGI